MTTSAFDLNSVSNSNGKKAKRVWALLALAMVSFVAGLGAITNDAPAIPASIAMFTGDVYPCGGQYV